jgi:hypothetical protein
MRTLYRRRDPQRDTTLAVIVALAEGETVESGELVMLEDVGAAMITSVVDPPASDEGLGAGERAVLLRVEALAYGNAAPDIP